MAARKRRTAGRGRRSATDPPRLGQPVDASPALPPHVRLRPWLLGATCALFVARPLFPSEGAIAEGDGLPVVMLWIALAAVWLLGAIGRPRFRLRLRCTDVAVIALVAWHTLAAVWAATHASPRPAINGLWVWIGMGLAYLLARQLIEGRREARAVAAVMVALAVALAGYGLYQCFYELPATRAFYRENPEEALRQTGQYYEPGSPGRQQFEARLASVEPLGTFALTNSLAGYLAPWLVVLAGIALAGGAGKGLFRFWGRSRSSRSEDGTVPLPRNEYEDRTAAQPWTPWLISGGLVAAGLIVAACLVLTKSRSAYVATALGLVLLWPLCRERKWRLGWKLPLAVVVVMAMLLGAATAVGGLDRQMLSEASKSLGYRVQYWQASLRMIADHPVVGCGPGNFQDAYTAYKLPEASEEVADPHNFLVEIWVTAGTPAMLAMLAVLGCFAAINLRFWVTSNRASTPEGARAADPGPDLDEDEEPAGDSPVAVYVGAGCGFLLSWPLGLISAAPLGVVPVLLGLPLAAGCVALLAGWVDHGRLPPLLPAVGVVVLLVNLLAAGGIGFPGVAGSLWLLLALGQCTTRADGPASAAPTLPRVSAAALLAVTVTLGYACYAMAYGPVLRCQAQMGLVRDAYAQPDFNAAEQHLLAAVKADPLAVEPWHQLVALALARAQHDPTPEVRARLMLCLDQYSDVLDRLAPNSNSDWLQAGQVYEQAFALTGNREQIQQAIAAYRRAVELYPNSGRCHARLALAHQIAGNLDGFRREADLAIRLDDEMPHADKKLPPELRQQLLRGPL